MQMHFLQSCENPSGTLADAAALNDCSLELCKTLIKSHFSKP